MVRSTYEEEPNRDTRLVEKSNINPTPRIIETLPITRLRSILNSTANVAIGRDVAIGSEDSPRRVHRLRERTAGSRVEGHLVHRVAVDSFHDVDFSSRRPILSDTANQ